MECCISKREATFLMTMFIDESDLCPALETLNEFGVHWSLIRLFYKISHDYRKGDDGIERRYASLP